MTPADALEIARLASLDRLDYARERAAAAKALGCTRTELDKMVKAARASFGGGPTASKPFVLSEIVPWDEEVEGVELLAALIDILGRFVVMGDQEKLAVALWIMHCFVIAATSITPRLAITSVFPESGKTTLLKVLRYLLPRPLHLVGLTGPTLFRMIEAWHPSLLFDEGNNWLFVNGKAGGGDDGKGDIVAIIDAGHERGVVVPRLVPSGNGEWAPHPFEVYGPLAIALIGKLPEQLDSRAIEIALTRRDASQAITRLHARRPPPELADLARQLARWGADHGDLLGEWEPKIPDEISNRTADNWEILLSIAEVVEAEAVGPSGSRPDYPQLTRDAAIAAGKSSKANRTTSNTRLTLLTDLKWLFDTEWEMDQKANGPNQFTDEASVEMFSADIVEELAKLEEKPWAEWGRARKPISVVQLARLLAPLKIRPHNVVRDDRQAKGYEREQFEVAWRKYL